MLAIVHLESGLHLTADGAWSVVRENAVSMPYAMARRAAQSASLHEWPPLPVVVCDAHTGRELTRFTLGSES